MINDSIFDYGENAALVASSNGKIVSPMETSKIFKSTLFRLKWGPTDIDWSEYDNACGEQKINLSHEELTEVLLKEYAATEFLITWRSEGEGILLNSSTAIKNCFRISHKGHRTFFFADPFSFQTIPFFFVIDGFWCKWLSNCSEHISCYGL